MRKPRTTSLELTAGISEIKCVFAVLGARVRAAITQTVTGVNAAVREALWPAPLVTGLARDLFRSREDLLAENAILRQQLIVASREMKQPKFRPFQRDLVVALSSVMKNWQNAVLLGWVAHFNRGRPHQGLEQRAPVPSDASSGASAGKVIALPALGGLHHEYRRVA